MPQRITPSKIVTVTKDGECHMTITLELNININSNGQVQVSNSPKEEESKETTEWAIPDFGSSNSNFLQFGKDVENAAG
jgi:hypothetical protein